MTGSYCTLEPLDPDRHADALWSAHREDSDGVGWTYLPYGPIDDVATYRGWVADHAATDDPLFFAVLAAPTGRASRVGAADRSAVGVASYLRIRPGIGSIEVGHIHWSPALRRTRAATEAMFLMMRRAFDELGYRRYEWKCDALNAPSRRAAERLGFTYEGTFRQAAVYKGRNRDTAWYSLVDGEWPRVRTGFRRWLEPSNFGGEGVQRVSLEAMRG